MKPQPPQPPQPPQALPCLALVTSIVAAGCGSCGKSPPEPAMANADASPVPSSSTAQLPFPSRLPRDDAGHLMPRTSPPIESDAAVTQRPQRDPDWDLDSDDPARDYVRRYALGTKRYGDNLDCADIGPSQPAGDRRRVEVKTASSCPGAGAVRDVFLVDVAGDRLTVDDRSKRNPLAHWPDGSDPEGQPGATREMVSMRDWKDPLKEAIQRQLLVPIRVQTFGRGTYPVVTLAGWHGAIVPGAGPDALHSLAESLCRATNGAPMGLLAGVDRSLILRVRCPPAARWDRL
jgi:hypothetical protein